MTYSTGCCWWTVWWEQTVTGGSDGSRHLVSGTTISCSRTNRGGIFSKFWNNEMIQNLPLLIRDGWELLNQHMNHVWPGSLCSTTSPLIPLHVEMLTRKREWLSLPPPLLSILKIQWNNDVKKLDGESVSPRHGCESSPQVCDSLTTVYTIYVHS